MRESVAGFFDPGWNGLEHDRGFPDREAFASHAAALKDAKFLRAQLLELDLQHLLKRFRDTWVEVLKGCGERPLSLVPGDQSSFHDVPHNRYHEQRVSA